VWEGRLSMSGCVFLCMCVFVHVCMRVCVCVCACKFVCAYTADCGEHILVRIVLGDHAHTLQPVQILQGKLLQVHQRRPNQYHAAHPMPYGSIRTEAERPGERGGPNADHACKKKEERESVCVCMCV
jgi:hypothetical protein